MKVFFIVIALSLSLIGSELLKVHRKLVPMILLQVKDIAKKKNKIIKILIVANTNELLIAQELKELIPKKIKYFDIKTSILEESNINELWVLNYDAIYAFSLSKKTYDMINQISLKDKIVTFSNSNIGLKSGMLVFIDKKKKINIYMNFKTMKQLKIPFNSKFLSIVKFVNE